MAGRPTLYTEEIGQRVCDRLADGETLNSICKDEELPAESTVRSWAIDPDHPISAKYRFAREVGYLKMAEEMLEISDDGSNDWMTREGKDGEGTAYQVNGEHVQRSRLRVETRKWILSKMLPKVYGDKVTSEHTGKDGGPIEVASPTSEWLSHVLGASSSRSVAQVAPQSDDDDDGQD